MSDLEGIAVAAPEQAVAAPGATAGGSDPQASPAAELGEQDESLCAKFEAPAAPWQRA